jgi:hypothetical protein
MSRGTAYFSIVSSVQHFHEVTPSGLCMSAAVALS